MSKTKRENEPPAIIELMLPLVGLLLVAVFFLPAFRQLLGTLLFLALGFIVLSLVVGMGLYIRHLKKLALADSPPAGRAAVPAAAPVASDVWSFDLLAQLEWKRFEELVAAYSHELGYTIKPLAGVAGHGTMLLFKNGRAQPAKPAMLVQCRAWDAVTVGLGPVRDLHDAMPAHQVGYGAYYTAGEFSAEAEDFAHGKILDLVNGREFFSRLRQLSPAVQQKLLEEATAGDFTTPTCPGCDIKMVRDDEAQPIGSESAWVCRNRPQCKRTLRVA